MNVNVICCCRKPELWYGTEMVFHSLRVGFPSARITVWDNASIPEMQPKILAMADGLGCGYGQTFRRLHHPDLLNLVLSRAPEGEDAVFLDSDVCFWRNVEGFKFDGLFAGALHPEYSISENGLTIKIAERIHSSFLWIKEPGEFRRKMKRVNPFLQDVRVTPNTIRYYDTGSVLLETLKGDMSLFNDEQSDGFFHLFYGSHFDIVKEQPAADAVKEFFEELHGLARKKDFKTLRTLKKRQGEYFKASFVDKFVQGERINKEDVKRIKPLLEQFAGVGYPPGFMQEIFLPPAWKLGL